MKPIEKVIAGRVRLLFRTVFFGTLITHLQLKEVPDLNPPTMATDGRSLFFHPEFSEKLSKPEMEFVLAHEVLHLALLSHLRRGTRDPKLWNYATDYCINLLLKDEHFQLLPDCLIDEKFRDWSAEKIYNWFQDNPDEQPQGGGSSVGEVMDAGTGDGGEPMTAEQVAAETSRMKAQIQAAVQAARKAGNLPGSIENLIEEICAPRANWKEILRRFVTEKAYSDWNFAQCNTRILAQTGIITPVLDGDELGELALIVDTSGSVREEELQQFGGEISDILESYPCKVSIVYCDTRVNRVDEFSNEDLPLQFHIVGRGGTQMLPAFQYVTDNLDECAAIILYSDSHVFDWAEIPQPDCPVLMAHTERNVSTDTPEWVERIDISED